MQKRERLCHFSCSGQQSECTSQGALFEVIFCFLPIGEIYVGKPLFWSVAPVYHPKGSHPSKSTRILRRFFTNRGGGGVKDGFPNERWPLSFQR